MIPQDSIMDGICSAEDFITADNQVSVYQDFINDNETQTS